jgi:amino acid adenylation domain-containing protein
MLDDGNTPVLLTKSSIITNHSFIDLKGLDPASTNLTVHRTEARKQVTDLEQVPIPDRSLVSYEKYHKDIGMAMTRHTVALQASRGCPYKCVYCHKIWPKRHVFRSAEHIFDEVKIYYDMGVRNFVIVDDIFNLNAKNSMAFFKLIIENKLDLHLFFPNGMRGDILTKDYIDLMVEAGTINLALALETASPRLQNLIGKNLNIDKLYSNMSYICEKHPHLISELFTMHGFPTETEEEAKLTMDFIKSLKWLHLPHVNILKIYPNTDMGDFAIRNGISPQAIARSENLAYHELPETLPFDERFTMQYQADYLDYFLAKERLLHVLPYQVKVLTRGEILQKYNSFLPTEINELDDLLVLADISSDELGSLHFLDEDHKKVPDLDKKMNRHFAPLRAKQDSNALKILLIDVTRFFGGEQDILYDVSEAPLGLMYLLSYLNKTYEGKINGKIIKSRTDYDSFEELKVRLDEFNPDLIGIRALTYFNQFFHKTVAMIRNWGYDGPIVAGGPYATSDYKRILQDKNIDLVVMGEGEVTFSEFVGKFMENGNKMPTQSVLHEIPGIVYIPDKEKQNHAFSRDIILLDQLPDILPDTCDKNPGQAGSPHDLAYTMFTSGSTGKPKAVLVKHQNVVRLVKNTNVVTLKKGDHFMQTAPLEFDASTIEIWGPLLNGLTFYMTREDNILNPTELKELIGKYKIDTLWMTSPLFNQILETDIGVFNGLKQMMIGGDTLSPTHINRLKHRYPELKVINGYGPTENTTFSTTYLIDREYESNIPIGKPISNSTAYILDKYKKPVPIGVAGELFVGGDGISKGYLNNPELTRQKFIANPFVPGDILYSTGDKTRWLSDGCIDFLGRVDFQVKMRGIRIELGEIESNILNHKEIKKTVVVTKEDKHKDKYLCAYIALNETPNPKNKTFDLAEFKRKLSETLPDYMIPHYFVQLEEIPLNANGKVDRKALPDPEIVAGEDHVPPRDELEQKLVEVWADVLNIDKEVIGIHSNFFDLGGHSLKATILVSMILKELDVKVPLAELFSLQTVIGLAEYIRHEIKDMTEQNGFISIDPVEEKEHYECSSVQKRMYVVQQLDPASIAYNIPETFYLSKDLDIHRLEHTFRELIRRHETFRTSFEIIGDTPVQKIHDDLEFEIEYHKARSETEVEKILEKFIRPFDLGRAPLLRVGVINSKLSNILLIDMHHIISDGTSHEVLRMEFQDMYEGKELPPLRLQYRDFAEWQNSTGQQQRIKEQETYWLTEFSDELPHIDLPTDYIRPAEKSFDGAIVAFSFDPTETRIIKKIAKETASTLYMAILGIFDILLAKLSGQEDIIVGTPVAARRHPDLQRIIGMFVNTLALRQFPAGEKTVNTFLQELKIRTLAAFENQEYPLEDLVSHVMIQRDPGRNPVFDVMFSLLQPAVYSGENLYDRENVGERENGPFVHKKCMSKFDLTLYAVDMDETLDFNIVYSTRLFKPETIEKYIGYFRTVTTQLYTTVEQRISEIEIVSGNEKKQLIDEFNRTETDFPKDKTIQQLFEEQVEKTPDKKALLGPGLRPALKEERQIITYRELNAAANQLARQLRQKGIEPDSAVAIMVEPSIEMIIGILAVLKAGAAFLPIDPDHPAKRKKYVLTDAGVDIILSRKKYTNRTFAGYHTINLDSDDVYTGTSENLELERCPDDLVYVIYTSGSTGKPKGVLLNQYNLVNYVSWFSNAVGLSEADKTILTSSFAFDLGYTAIFTSILNGGELHLLKKGIYLAPEHLVNYMKQNQITYIKVTPSLYTIIANSPSFSREMMKALRLIVLGGEEIKLEDVKKTNDTCPHISIMNHYGPTEATIGTIARFIDFEHFEEYKTNPSIGTPIHNTNVFILDQWLNLQPIGVPGDLYISGACLARGYLNRPELTAEKFIPLPFTHHPSPIYKTGDLAKWLPDGNVAFLGRKDGQVKIRGYRIELGEIENRLLKDSRIKETVVIVNEDRNMDKYISAYMVLKTQEHANTGNVDFRDIKKKLQLTLPDYMIPAHFAALDKIPLTANGKVNRRALPEPGMSAPQDLVAPETDLEKKLAGIWADVLGTNIEAIGIHTNFFELGGHSLKATLLAAKISDILNRQVPLVEIFKVPTIAGLSRYIENTGNPVKDMEINDEKLVLLKQGSDETKHIFFIHDGIGKVDGYIELCKHLTNDFNCWGIRAGKFNRLAPRNITITDIAQEYIETIKKVEPKGPYHIVGWSLGGMIACEIIRQLEAQNAFTGLFAMIDTYINRKDLSGNVKEFSVETELDTLQNLLENENILHHLNTDVGIEKIWEQVVDYFEADKNRQGIIDHIIERYHIQRMLPHIYRLSVREKIQYINVMRSFRRARMHFIPKGKIKTLLHFFAAKETPGDSVAGSDPVQVPWNEYSKDSMVTYKISGDHYSILNEPNITNLATMFDNALKLN